MPHLSHPVYRLVVNKGFRCLYVEQAGKHSPNSGLIHYPFIEVMGEEFSNHI
jgi:hypothetical protein